MRGVGQLDTGGNSGRVQRRRGEVHVQRLGSVELGDRQRPDQIVEVTRVALSDWLRSLIRSSTILVFSRAAT